MIPKEQNTPAYTSRRYSWPGKKVSRELEDREKSGGASLGSFLTWLPNDAFLTATPAGEAGPMGVILLMYRDPVTNEIIAIIIPYNGGIRVVVLEQGTET